MRGTAYSLICGSLFLLSACMGNESPGGPTVVNPISGPLTGISGTTVFGTQNAKLRFDCATCSVESWLFKLTNDHEIEIDPATGQVTIIDYGFRDDTFALDFLGNAAAYGTVVNYESTSAQSTLTMLLPGTKSGYRYSSYGVFDRAFFGCFLGYCASTFQAEVFSFGVMTGKADMPTTGTASYAGTMDGFYSAYTQRAVRFHGDVALVANFETHSLDGQVTGITSTAIFGSNSTFGDMAFGATISGNGFEGPASGSADGIGLTGTVSGSFYGPQATEAGGVLHLTSASGAAVGAFSAKQ